LSRCQQSLTEVSHTKAVCGSDLVPGSFGMAAP
jgi:hypothetical protein